MNYEIVLIILFILLIIATIGLVHSTIKYFKAQKEISKLEIMQKELKTCGSDYECIRDLFNKNDMQKDFERIKRECKLKCNSCKH
jgi:hypothetical protein